jgi:alpha-beta hydrolase superfamily lysophospholipase
MPIALILSFLFFTPHVSLAQTASRFEIREVEATTQDGMKLPGISVFPRTPPKAVVMIVHGLQGNSLWFRRSGLMEELARLGIASFAFDRRSTPRAVALNQGEQRPGDLLDPSHAVLDLRAQADEVLKYAREKNITAHITGESFGGILAHRFLTSGYCGFNSMIALNASLALQRIARFDSVTILAMVTYRPGSYFSAIIEEDLLARPSGQGESQPTPFEAFLRSNDSGMQREFTARYFLWARTALNQTLASIARKDLPGFPIYWVFAERDQVVDSTASIALIEAAGATWHRNFVLPQAAHIPQTIQLQRRIAMQMDLWITRERLEAGGETPYFCEGLRR